jgi:transcriptional regulator with XRE-family HTH domain
MFEIDKATFGEFLANLRKEKGYTQKNLAAKLFVSDKAVSKWERGLSMPDISLLIPLAEILGVTVTELLEGRKFEQTEEMDVNQVEVLVQKTLKFSEDTPERRKERHTKHFILFGGCTLLSILELFAGICYLAATKTVDHLSTSLLVMELLSFIFGVYFWFFIKERLPSYYDENKISAYSDGIFRMNMVGVTFNNSNWPYIVKCGRTWTATTLVLVPIAILFSSVVTNFLWNNVFWMGTLTVYLLTLFLPIYIVGRKYS